MAALALPKPGSKYSPCLEACTHTDCAATREMAAHLHRLRRADRLRAALLPRGARRPHPLRLLVAAEDGAGMSTVDEPWSPKLGDPRRFRRQYAYGSGRCRVLCPPGAAWQAPAPRALTGAVAALRLVLGGPVVTSRSPGAPLEEAPCWR
jgi:hypothetical protein